MASIGYNITFGDNREKTVEIHLLDYSLDIYGEKVKVYWHKRLRGEEKFSSKEALIEQMQQDEIDTRAFFENYYPYQ